jgi:glycosyltransferase involved in cell wall biosynthesis
VRLPSRFQPDLAILHRFRSPPYGGSNQFLTALRGELRVRGLRVSDGVIGRRTRACLLHSYLVDVDKLRPRLHPSLRIVHRVDGPIALYRGVDDGSDHRIVEINRALAEATVFQSQYSLDAHREAGLDLRDPVVISNAVDPRIFHPPPYREPAAGRRLRLIATSWSDNPRKGAGTIGRLARVLDPDRFELTFVGRTAVELEGATVVPAVPSRTLADLLRANDAYVMPSRHEACSNALLEALSCGLPALYVRSGSNPELVGAAGWAFDGDDELPSLLDRVPEELEDRRARIRVTSLSEVADRYVDVLGLR